METTNPAPVSGRNLRLVGALVILALVPSTFLFATGRRDRSTLEERAVRAEAAAQALNDSLDAARTQLLSTRVAALAAAGETERAREMASTLFDRVDRRSRAPGAPAEETAIRLRVLERRDELMVALTRGDPGALRILAEVERLHLPLADPTVDVRTSRPEVPQGPRDTVGQRDTAR